MSKTIFKVYIIVNILLFVSCRTAEKELYINLDDYGISEKKDATPIVIKALEDAKKNKAAGLIFPEGTYYFNDKMALEKYLSISNNDNGLSKLIFDLSDFKSFTIDGNNSKFIFDGQMVPFVIEESTNIKLQNFSIDWKRPFYGQAEVMAINKDDRTMDIKIDGEFDYEIHHNRLFFKTTRGFHNIEQNLFWYPNQGGTVYNVNAYKLDPWNKWPSDSYEAKALENGQVRIKSFKGNLLPEVGWTWVAKGRNGERRSPAIRIYNSKNITFYNVKIYHSGGIGLIAEKTENVTIDKMVVTPTPNSKRAISTTADATHFVNCKGKIAITNSYFSNMMDDATNVHGIYTKIDTILSSKSLGIKQIHHQQQGFDFAAKGDSIRIIDNETLLPVFEAVVKDYRWFNGAYQEVDLDKEISIDVKSGFAIENISWNASLHFVNNIVEKNRARGIIFSTNNVLVENNRFSSMMSAISISPDANFWFESGSSKNIVINNNEFINCTTGGKGESVIKITPVVLKPSHKKGYFNENISITNNSFKAFDKAILSTKSVDGLVFKSNKVINSESFTPLFLQKPTFELLFSKNIIISDNEFNSFQNGDIKGDSITIQSIQIKNNKGGFANKPIIDYKTEEN